MNSIHPQHTAFTHPLCAHSSYLISPRVQGHFRQTTAAASHTPVPWKVPFSGSPDLILRIRILGDVSVQ